MYADSMLTMLLPVLHGAQRTLATDDPEMGRPKRQEARGQKEGHGLLLSPLLERRLAKEPTRSAT